MQQQGRPPESLFRRWMRFNLVGAFGVSVQLGILAALVHATPTHYLVASTIAVEASVLHNFVWHSRWTWADRRDAGHSKRRMFARFHLTSASISIGANLAMMPLLVDVLGVNVLVANAATIVACGLLNFALSDRFAFAS
jgi:putative flippase GtrA